MSAHLQEPFLSLWMTTRTCETQAVGPLEVTWPETRLFGSNLNETVRALVPPPVTVKIPALVPVTVALLTWIWPVVAPLGTVAVIWVVELTTNVAVLALKNLTAVIPVKFVPVITTLDPTVPLVGVKDVIVGLAPVTVNEAATGPPLEFVTWIVPAPSVVLGTVTVMLVLLKTVFVAEIPLISTVVAPQKLVPVTVTVAPMAPVPAKTVGAP